jgi:hypothetical protein
MRGGAAGLRALLRRFLLAVEIAGKEATLPFVASPLAKANAEAHIHGLRRQLTQMERS